MSILTHELFILSILHCIGDFFLQTREMADNKSTSYKWLTIHVLVYSIPFIAVGLFFFPIKYVLAFVIFNGFMHWCTDSITSKWTKYFYQKKNTWAFFAVIGFDQVLHLAQYVIAYLEVLDKAYEWNLV